LSRIAKIPKEQSEKITKIFKLARMGNAWVFSRGGQWGFEWGVGGGCLSGIKFSYEKLTDNNNNNRGRGTKPNSRKLER